MADKSLTRGAIRKVKERAEDELLAIPGVQGVDINEKIVKGRGTGKLSIVVYVKKKQPKSKLTKKNTIPEEIDGISTDIQEEEIVLQSAYAALADLEPQVDTNKYTPLRGGISMGPCRSIDGYIYVGTFGAIVKDRSSGAHMALTNFHVACVDDGWSVGDIMAQPSRVDGGSCPSDRFGTLTRATLSENVDGAVVTLDSGIAKECSIEGIGDVKGTIAASNGMLVRKRGRTTELTYGSVNSTDVSVSIDYGDGLGSKTLKHQIRVIPDTTQNPRFSDGGDSGSVVVDGNKKVLGLLYAGTTSGSASFLNPIQKVLDELDVDLCVKTFTLMTHPIVCGPILTKPTVCYLTKPTACHIVTKPSICQILTSPKHCQLLTKPVCEIKTLACPPMSLVCGWDRPPVSRDAPRNFENSPTDAYGRHDVEVVDDAFWLGYYTALEALSEAEEEKSKR